MYAYMYETLSLSLDKNTKKFELVIFTINLFFNQKKTMNNIRIYIYT
jgi:hypothetical protein